MNFTDLVELFSSMEGFKKVDHEIYDHVYEISSEDAFDLSAIIGSSYLISPTGISMKGRNEVFIHRSVFQEGALIYSPGLFGRDLNGEIIENNGAIKLRSKYPSVFSGSKKVIFQKIGLGHPSNIEKNIFDKLEEEGENCENCLVLKIHENSSLEPILEYLAYKKFNSEGYIFENQVPFFQQSFKYKNRSLRGGIPDICAFKTPALNSFLSRGIISVNEGILLNKVPYLSAFKLLKKKKPIKHPYKYELILGEAKGNSSSLSQAIIQMDKYASVDLADEIYSFIPDCQNNERKCYGELFLEESNVTKKGSQESLSVNQGFRDEDEKFLTTTLKLNLLANLDFDILKEKIIHSLSIKTNSFYSCHLLQYALEIEIEEVFKFIEEQDGLH